GHRNQWCPPNTSRPRLAYAPPAATGQYYIQPFMVGLTAEALIQHYETQTPQDARIPAAIKLAMDWLWANAWVAADQGFWYDNWVSDPTQPFPPNPGAPDLNLLIAPAFAWLYKQTGDTTYRDRAASLFAGGVTRGCASCDGKHFNQAYRWSFDYMKWRNEASSTPPAAPTALSVR